MYLISGLAFLIYITRIPERFFKGEAVECARNDGTQILISVPFRR